MKICEGYSEIFSRQVKKTPANVSPMHIECDVSKWNTRANRTGPRLMSPDKISAIRDFTEKLLQLGVIRRSNATAYSHPLLTKKVNGDWRFVIDFRRLNDACSKSEFPLPSIELIIQRVGRSAPKYFGVMDYT